MDVQNALHRWKNALYAHTLSLEILQRLPRYSDDKTVLKADRDEREAWHKLAAARREVKEAILESIGR